MTGLCNGIYRIFILDSSLKSLALFLVLGTLLLLRHRASSAEHHSIWKFGLLSLLFLPLLSSLLPIRRLPVLPAILASPYENMFLQTSSEVVNSPGVPVETEIGAYSYPTHSSTVGTRFAEPISPTLPVRTVVRPYHDKSTLLTANPAPRSEWRSWVITALCLLWLIVCSVLWLELLFDLLKLARLKRQSTPIHSDSTTVLAEGLAKELGIKRRFVLYSTPNVMPMAWGWLHPVILLPTETETWPVGRLRIVLLHELAHIRRNDWLTQRLARLVCAFYWFNPLVWLALRAIRRESECACDDLVLSTGVGAPEYAQQLLEVIRIMKHLRPVSRATVAMAQSAHIQSRLSAILDPNRKRGGFTRHGLAISMFCLAGLIPLSLTQVTAQQNTSPTSPTQKVSPPTGQVSVQASPIQHKTPSKLSGKRSDLASIIASLQDETAALEALSSELKQSATASNLPSDMKTRLIRQQEHVQSQLSQIRTHLKTLKFQQKRAVVDENSRREAALQDVLMAQKQAAEAQADMALKVNQVLQQTSESQAKEHQVSEAELAELQSQLVAQQTDLKFEQSNLNRAVAQHNAGLVTASDLDTALSRVAAVEANLAETQARIQVLKVRLSGTIPDKQSSNQQNDARNRVLQMECDALKRQIEQKQAEVARLRELLRAGAIEAKDLDEAQAQLLKLQGQLRAAELRKQD